jgi:two-component system response regulator FixJ
VLKIASSMVILVDDDVDVLNSLRFAFEIEGYSVRTHLSAEAVLSGEPLPDRGCLVVDQRLPGMTGLALVKHLRDSGYTLPAVLITTPSQDVVNRAAAAGVALVEKPLLCDSLVAKVKDLISAA